MKKIKTKRYHYYENDKGQKHGEYKEYYPSGQLEYRCHYKNGKLHGEFKEYYSNGQLWEHRHYKNDNRHVEYKHYYNNGHLYIHAYRINGKEVHNFKKDGDSPEIRMFLYFTYAAPFLGE